MAKLTQHNGWAVDHDDWLVRSQRPGEVVPKIGDTAGFVLNGKIYVRTTGMADALDAGREVPRDWFDRPELLGIHPGEEAFS